MSWWDEINIACISTKKASAFHCQWLCYMVTRKGSIGEGVKVTTDVEEAPTKIWALADMQEVKSYILRAVANVPYAREVSLANLRVLEKLMPIKFTAQLPVSDGKTGVKFFTYMQGVFLQETKNKPPSIFYAYRFSACLKSKTRTSSNKVTSVVVWSLQINPWLNWGTLSHPVSSKCKGPFKPSFFSQVRYIYIRICIYALTLSAPSPFHSLSRYLTCWICVPSTLENRHF